MNQKYLNKNENTRIDNNLILNYIKDITNRPPKEKFIFFIQFFIFLGLPIDFFTFITKKKNEIDDSNIKSFILVILILFQFFINQIFQVNDIISQYISIFNNEYLLSRYPSFETILQTVICLFLNLITFSIIKKFANFQILFHNQLIDVSNKLEESQNQIDQIIGHKIWSQNNTYNLLNDIMSFNEGRKSKWFIIHFLAYLTDERIQTHPINDHQSKYHLVNTGNNHWSLYKYSKFIFDYIEQAEIKIQWLIDPTDFMNVHLPLFIKYYLAAIAITVTEAPDVNFMNKEDSSFIPLEVFSYLRNPKENYKVHEYFTFENENEKNDWVENYCNNTIKECIEQIDKNKIIFIDENKVKLKSIKNIENYDYNAQVFEEVILKVLILLGYKLLKNKKIDYSMNIKEGFNKLFQMYIDNSMPHLKAFKDIPGYYLKERILLIGFNYTNAHDETDWISDELRKHLSESSWSYKLDKDNNLIHFINDQILIKAYELFEVTCGNADVIKFRGYKEPDPRISQDNNLLDVGMYDEKFIVSSYPINSNEGQKRFVEWLYLNTPINDYNSFINDFNETYVKENEYLRKYKLSIEILVFKDKIFDFDRDTFLKALKKIFIKDDPK